MVRCWQEDILAVAKEEMGHLLTVQNILMLIGAPINLDRQDLPWDIPFHPGMFRLEQLTLDSVAFYVFAEMPSADELDALIQETDHRDELLGRYKRFREIDREQIEIMVRTRDSTPHRVGDLYSQLAKLVEQPPPHTRLGIPGMDLDPSSLGRRLGPRLSTRSTAGHGRRKLRSTNRANPWAAGAQPIVLIYPVATRTQVRKALEELSAQGEGPVGGTGGSSQLSHFDRFLKDLSAIQRPGVPTLEPLAPSRRRSLNPRPPRGYPGYIAEAHSRDWAELFNLRYRMLLKYLGHTFRLARTQHGDSPNLRSMVMHRVFGEMYNLKAIAAIIVRQPLSNGSRAPAPRSRCRILCRCRTPSVISGLRTVTCWPWPSSTARRCSPTRTAAAMPISGRSSPSTATRRTWAERILAGLGSMEGPQP